MTAGHNKKPTEEEEAENAEVRSEEPFDSFCPAGELWKYGHFFPCTLCLEPFAILCVLCDLCG
jgi:hypothetical protein